ncbi:hypothetical protein PF010_g12195 [Phytophthora fragariae]|nr:hypothetical protein PF010_g12195 [Phytophthora fragariae]KAE9250196.1 hypothetical protein PF002_g4896 [Phytophthora fragariae]
MNSLGVILNFEDTVVRWEGCSLSLNTGHGAAAPDADKQQDSEFPE